MATSGEALALYRRILRLHRQKLPFHLKQLGDSYVREEFKRHKKAEAKWLVNFFQEWTSYAGMLEQQNPVAGAVGSPLPKDAVRAMTDEQKVQLLKLKEEAAKPYMDG